MSLERARWRASILAPMLACWCSLAPAPALNAAPALDTAPALRAPTDVSTPAPPPLEVIVLGSGGPGATGRASASYAVLIDGAARILVDAGSGAFVRLGESRLDLAALDTVLLTHLHADHASELPGIVKARAVSSSGPIAFNIFGPPASPGSARGAYFPSTGRFVNLLFGPRGAFAYLRNFAAPITFEPHEVPAAPRTTSLGSFTVSTVAGHHGDAPAVIYRIDHGGKSVTFSGDIDAAGLSALRRIADRTDLLIFNAVVLDPPESPAVLYTLHSPPRAIGEVAREARVRGLLLSHLSPATASARDSVLRSIRRSYDGPSSMADDGMHVRP